LAVASMIASGRSQVFNKHAPTTPWSVPKTAFSASLREIF